MSNSQRIVYALVFIIGSILVLRKRKELAWPLLIMYGFAVIYVTFLIRDPDEEVRISLAVLRAWKRAFLVKGEFVLSFDRLRYLKQTFLNILLFIPAGYFLPLMSTRDRKWWEAVLFGLAMSLGIELLQVVTRLGMFDVDDLINNTVGAGVGWSFWRVLLRERR